MVPAHDGWPLRTFDRPGDGRGTILWLGGRGDIFEKYFESFAHWHARGWGVTSFDWRGQGGSGRLLADRGTGHMPDFGAWLDDLAAFWADWTARTPAPHVVMGHSMGGNLVLRALIDARIAPRAVVLSAPMLGFDAGRMPQALAARVTATLGRAAPTRRAWKENERPARPNELRQIFLTHDLDRYADELFWKDADPDLRMGPPSWAWVAAAYRSNAAIGSADTLEHVEEPILIVATEGDRLVSPRWTRDTAARLPNAELMMFGPDVAHEVLREVDTVRDRALTRIDAFLEVHAPQ